SGSSSGQAAQTSSGPRPESQSWSSSSCTRESTAMTALLEAVADHDSRHPENPGSSGPPLDPPTGGRRALQALYPDPSCPPGPPYAARCGIEEGDQPMNSVAHPTFSRLRAIEYGGRWNPPHGNTCAKPAPQNSQAGPVRRTGSKPLPGRSSVLGHEHRTARCP